MMSIVIKFIVPVKIAAVLSAKTRRLCQRRGKIIISGAEAGGRDLNAFESVAFVSGEWVIFRLFFHNLPFDLSILKGLEIVRPGG